MPIIGLESADGENRPPVLLQKGGPVKRYNVVINGVETTLQLTEEDAKARGLTSEEKPAPAKKAAKAPANKARSASNKGNG